MALIAVPDWSFVVVQEDSCNASFALLGAIPVAWRGPSECITVHHQHPSVASQHNEFEIVLNLWKKLLMAVKRMTTLMVIACAWNKRYFIFFTYFIFKDTNVLGVYKISPGSILDIHPNDFIVHYICDVTELVKIITFEGTRTYPIVEILRDIVKLISHTIIRM